MCDLVLQQNKDLVETEFSRMPVNGKENLFYGATCI